MGVGISVCRPRYENMYAGLEYGHLHSDLWTPFLADHPWLPMVTFSSGVTCPIGPEVFSIRIQYG